tara:strand:+ start:867 stop:2003 length:1137 start_codon:yes stop_codon:yes gene_type:complete
MAKVKKVAYDLRTLPLGEHRLISIIKLIVDADQYQKEGLFNNSPFGRIINKPYNDNFYPDEIIRNLREFFPNGLEDLWVDISYQRVLKLKKLIEHLRRKDMNGSDLLFNKMLCGSVDIAIRPNGKGYVWDGFRRCIIALLNGIRFIKASVETHDSSTSIEDCRKLEAFVYEIKNGESESMTKEELYKSGIVYQKEDALKLQKVINEMCVDVLGTNPGNPELGAFSEFQDTVLKEKLETTDYLVQASFKQQKAWSEDNTLTGYLTCGLAKFLDTLNKEDEDGNPVCPSIEIHTAHPNLQGTCEVENALVRYSKKHKQVDLIANRLAGMAIESVAFNIGRVVMNLNKSQQFELLTALGFEGDEELMNQLTLVPSKKTLAA